MEYGNPRSSRDTTEKGYVGSLLSYRAEHNTNHRTQGKKLLGYRRMAAPAGSSISLFLPSHWQLCITPRDHVRQTQTRHDLGRAAAAKFG